VAGRHLVPLDRVFLLDLVQQLAPGLLLGRNLVRAAGRQDDLEAGVAGDADGDVVQVVRVDARLEPAGELFRLPVGWNFEMSTS
jgi:hypothetical protein